MWYDLLNHKEVFATSVSETMILSETEVEVTPAMIEAGVNAIGEWYPDWLDLASPKDPAPVLRAVFTAMVRARSNVDAS
jgi:hypothetical protein